jgi:hypothetical protein
MNENAPTTKYRRRRLVLVCVLLAVWSVYMGCYFILSRRGVIYDVGGGRYAFVYVRPDDSSDWLKWHYRCVPFFEPAHFVERQLGFGYSPISGFTLSK